MNLPCRIHLHSPSASSSLARLCFLLLLASLLTAGCGKPAAEKPRRSGETVIPVTVARVESKPVDRTLSIYGTLFAKDEATISAEVEGQVERTFAEFGDRLTNGQLIAQINTTTYTALANQAAAAVSRAKATLDNADQNLRRQQQLGKSQIASQSDIEAAVAADDQARAELKSAEANEVIARINLDRSHVRAPFDSAVADRIASAGDFMRVGTPLFRIVNDHVLKYIVQAPERYAGQIKKEQLVQFTADAWGAEVFQGKVYLISPQVSTATRAFAFGALVQNPDLRLKANTFARGEVILERAVPTPVVPLDAVVSFAGVTKVFVVSDDVARSRQVTVGRILDGTQEMLAGLKPGETVVTSGQSKLFDGVRVKARDQASAPESRAARN